MINSYFFYSLYFHRTVSRCLALIPNRLSSTSNILLESCDLHSTIQPAHRRSRPSLRSTFSLVAIDSIRLSTYISFSGLFKLIFLCRYPLVLTSTFTSYLRRHLSRVAHASLLSIRPSPFRSKHLYFLQLQRDSCWSDRTSPIWTTTLATTLHTLRGNDNPHYNSKLGTAQPQSATRLHRWLTVEAEEKTRALITRSLLPCVLFPLFLSLFPFNFAILKFPPALCIYSASPTLQLFIQHPVSWQNQTFNDFLPTPDKLLLYDNTTPEQ